MADKWCAEKALTKLLNRASKGNELCPQVIMEHSEDVSLFDLEETLICAARIVNLYGDEYLDFFQRIQDEIAIKQSKFKVMEEVRKLALKSLESDI